MSRVRTRPTRDDTRDKLFEAAARVFEEQGIGGASIETIAAAAGFSRGAFYSNFKSKDELIIAMLEDHVDRSIRRNRDLLAQHGNIEDFLEALKNMDRKHDPLGRAPLLHMEMILYVARAEKRRPELAKRLRAPDATGRADRNGIPHHVVLRELGAGFADVRPCARRCDLRLLEQVLAVNQDGDAVVLLEPEQMPTYHASR